jgi:hypothetical protein
MSMKSWGKRESHLREDALYNPVPIDPIQHMHLQVKPHMDGKETP